MSLVIHLGSSLTKEVALNLRNPNTTKPIKTLINQSA